MSDTGRRGRPATRNIKETCKAVTVRLPNTLLQQMNETISDKTAYITGLIQSDMDANYTDRALKSRFVRGEISALEYLDAEKEKESAVVQGMQIATDAERRAAPYAVCWAVDCRNMGIQPTTWTLAARFAQRADAEDYCKIKTAADSGKVWEIVEQTQDGGADNDSTANND